MLIYVSHKYEGDRENIEDARRISHNLQTKDLENCYLCPLIAFSHLDRQKTGVDEMMELCLDVLQECDTLIITSEVSAGVQKELDFARMVGMEVLVIDKDGELQPFTE